MKKLYLTLFLSVFISAVSISQNFKNSFGYSLQYHNYTHQDQDNDEIKSVEAAQSSGGFSADYRRYINDKILWQVGLEVFSRNTFTNNSIVDKTEVNQSFLRIPIGIGFYEKIKRENPQAIKSHYANYLIGSSLSILNGQGINSSRQLFFEQNDKWFEYYQVDFFMEFSYSIMPQSEEFNGHTFGTQVRWNPKSFAWRNSSSIVETDGFITFVFFYRFELYLSKGKQK